MRETASAPLAGSSITLDEFSKRFSEMRVDQPLEVAFSNEIENVLKQLICLCIESENEDPLTREGKAVPVVQDMFREFGVSEKVLTMLQSRFVPNGTKKSLNDSKQSLNDSQQSLNGPKCL